MSLPSREAWIEISVCSLKVDYQSSLPPREARIEITTCGKMRIRRPVASPAGSVD